MTLPKQSEKQYLEDYLKAHGFGLSLPGSSVNRQVKKTGNIVQDYIAAAGFGLKKPQL